MEKAEIPQRSMEATVTSIPLASTQSPTTPMPEIGAQSGLGEPIPKSFQYHKSKWDKTRKGDKYKAKSAAKAGSQPPQSVPSTMPLSVFVIEVTHPEDAL